MVTIYIYNTDTTTVSNCDVIIADNATTASAVYAIVLRTEKTTPEIWQFYHVEEIVKDTADQPVAVTDRTFDYQQTFTAIWSGTKHKATNMASLKAALKYWLDNNSLLYLTYYDADRANLATTPNSSYVATQVTMRNLKVVWSSRTASEAVSQIFIRRYAL